MNNQHYLTWLVEDGEHVGLCHEFPSLSWLAPTREEALRGIRQAVADALVASSAATSDKLVKRLPREEVIPKPHTKA